MTSRAIQSHVLAALAAFLIGVAGTHAIHRSGEGGRSEELAVKRPGGAAWKRGEPGDHGSRSWERAGKTRHLAGEVEEDEPSLDVLVDEVDQELRESKFLQPLVARQRQVAEGELEARLALWSDRMRLTDEQVMMLRRRMETDLEDRVIRSPVGWTAVVTASADRKNPAEENVRALLDGVLSDEQKAAYELLQEEQKWNGIESRAMRRLAEVQARLDLSESQRDGLLEIFHAEEEARGRDGTAKRPDYRGFIEAGGAPAAWRDYRDERERVAREEKLVRVRGVLNERQLRVYRELLERR